MAPSRSTIRFVCSNCISPLEVKRRYAGAKMRCPWCHTTLVVPQESRPDVKAEVYGLAGETAGPEPSAQPTVSFLCKLCGTRMDAPADRAGQRVECPDCGTPATVPVRSVSATPAAGTPGAVPDAGPADIYNVLEGQDQPPPTATEVYRRHIPVVCTLCQTRMHATEDQVGQIVVCPDCGTANIVPAAQKSDSPAPMAAVEGYQLAAASDQPVPTAPNDRREFTFTCPLCQTRLQAARDQAGQKITCPDCGTAFPVPKPPSDDRQWDPFQETVDIYAVAGGQAAPATHGPAPAPPAERPEPKSLAEVRPNLVDRELLPPRRSEQKLPPWPLVNGVFTFPFYSDALVCWGKLAAGAMVVLAIAGFAVSQMRALDHAGFGLGAAGLAAVTLYTVGFVCIVAAIFSVWCSSSVLKILTETANGVDRIEEWANQEFVEWAFESLYLVNSVVLSILIGWGVQAVAPQLPPGSAVVGSLFFLFPVILLSMLETGTALNPISPPVLRSLFSRCWAWWGFYALAAILLAATAAAVIGLWLLMGTWSAIPSALLSAPAMMIYFRLLGRLGWYITVKARRGKTRSAD